MEDENGGESRDCDCYSHIKKLIHKIDIFFSFFLYFNTKLYSSLCTLSGLIMLYTSAFIKRDI